MDRDFLTASIKGLSEDAKFLLTAWNDGDEYRIATTIKAMRVVLHDAETMLKDDMFRRLTSTPAFTKED